MERSPKPRTSLATKPLLSVDETATLLGENRSTIYRAIKAGTLPLPVFVIGRRLRIPRLAVERLISGLPPLSAESERLSQGDDDDGAASSVGFKRRATCSAARRSSSGTTSV
jgi:excisionase family DNA binding protein